MSANRLHGNTSFSFIQGKFVGTGHADATKHEWAVNQHRDSYASAVGHNDMLTYVAVVSGDSIGRARYQMLEKMLQPCGKPPTKADDA